MFIKICFKKTAEQSMKRKTAGSDEKLSKKKADGFARGLIPERITGNVFYMSF